MGENRSARQHLQENLRALIGDESVLAWSNRHKLVQTTIARAINGKQDLTTTKLQEVADALGLQAWQLIAPDLGAGMWATVQQEKGPPQVLPIPTRPVVRQQSSPYAPGKSHAGKRSK